MKTWITKRGYRIIRVLTGASNSYLISNGEKYILIDTSLKCFWNNLQRKLEGLKINKSNLEAVILTHTHFDHSENIRKIKESFNPKILVHNLERKNLEKGENPLIKGTVAATKLLVALSGENIDWLFKYDGCEVDIPVDNKFSLENLGFEGYILHTPGHTEGSISVVIDDFALVGDAIFGLVPKSVKPPFAVGENSMINSYKRLLDTNCSVFLPGHGGEMKRELLKRRYLKERKKLL